QHIDGFNANFEFSTNPGSGDPADGFTFILQQNDPTSAAAIGGGGGALGWVGLRNSFAVKFDIYPGKLNQIGVYHNGIDISDDAGDPRNAPVPVGTFDFESQTRFHVDLTYNDAAKRFDLKLDDIGNAATAPFTRSWNI